MLKINYATDISNKEKMDGLFNAIHYESNTMMIAVTVSYDGRKFMNLLATIAFQYICG